MASFVKTWGHNVNQALPNTLTQVEQYQNLFLGFHNLFVSAGYTVLFSSDGVTAAAGNNITTLADVVVAGGTSNRTWALYEFPASARNRGQILLEAEDTATTTPQDIRITFSALPFDTSAISASDAPEEGSTNTFESEGPVTIRDWTTPVDGAWHGIYSDRGDIIFGAKRQSVEFFESLFFIRCDDPDETDADGPNLCCWSLRNPSSASAGGLEGNTSDKVGGYTNFDGSFFTSLGPAGPTAFGPTSGIHQSFWSNGLDGDGNLLLFEAAIISNTSPWRYMGKWVDIKICSARTPFGAVEDGDSDPIRYMYIGGGLMVPWPSSEFPVL